jgi:aromatic-L-amino-acid/L-tryptophan decarboxylase
MNFDLDKKTRRELGYRLIDLINDYFSSLPDRAVQLPLEQRHFPDLHERMPEAASDAMLVLDDICHELVDKGFHIPSANYFGLINPTPTYMAVLAEMLVAALNPQLASLARSQMASRIEHETISWIAERIGWIADSTHDGVPHPSRREGANQSFGGTFTSGGNEANFTGMLLALVHAFPAAIENGVASIGAQPIVYTSSEAHHSLEKSLGMMGVGRRALRRLQVTDALQLDTRKLEARIAEDFATGYKPFCVVATAGTTSSGAIDDLETIAEICRRYHLWLHVDGAYGAAAVFSDKHRRLVSGIERADSLSLDPHKWLSMPFAAGLILTRHPEMLRRAFEVTPSYMPRAENAELIDNFKISAQWSRRMNSLKLWLTLRVHGRKAYEDLIDRQMKLAGKFHQWVQASDEFEVTAPMYLPIVNFSLKANGRGEAELAAANAALVDEITRDGRHWISSTIVNGRRVIRMMVISYLSDEHNLAELQKALSRAAQLSVLQTKAVGSRSL